MDIGSEGKSADAEKIKSTGFPFTGPEICRFDYQKQVGRLKVFWAPPRDWARKLLQLLKGSDEILRILE